MDTEPRQAVIVVHGIGEQRPMETLRGFVRLLFDGERVKPKSYSKPDHVSGLYELRRIRVNPWHGHRPGTDFFEYYWAQNMRDTQARQVTAWLLKMVLTYPKKPIAASIRRAWWVTVISSVATILFLATTAWAAISVQVSAAVASRSVLAFFVSLGVSIVSGNYLYVIGDAARYLDPTADNVAQREAIRKGGVQLIRRLHRGGKYQRIVIVGHSLGSVIAYDLIRFAWEDYRKTYAHPRMLKGEVLEEMESLITKVAGNAEQASESDVKRLHELQRLLWQEQRKLGNPWLITDLVTLGSPLAHGGYLLSDSLEDFQASVDEGVLPQCPPEPYEKDVCSYFSNQWLLIERAPFACVRWTNVYYPGDLIGGEVRPWFGWGVKDVRVVMGGWRRLLSHTPLSHTRYWRAKPSDMNWTQEAGDALWAGMDLENWDLLNPPADAGRVNVVRKAAAAPTSAAEAIEVDATVS